MIQFIIIWLVIGLSSAHAFAENINNQLLRQISSVMRQSSDLDLAVDDYLQSSDNPTQDPDLLHFINLLNTSCIKIQINKRREYKLSGDNCPVNKNFYSLTTVKNIGDIIISDKILRLELATEEAKKLFDVSSAMLTAHVENKNSATGKIITTKISGVIASKAIGQAQVSFIGTIAIINENNVVTQQDLTVVSASIPMTRVHCDTDQDAATTKVNCSFNGQAIPQGEFPFLWPISTP